MSPPSSKSSLSPERHASHSTTQAATDAAVAIRVEDADESTPLIVADTGYRQEENNDDREVRDSFFGNTYPRPQSHDWKWWVAGFALFLAFLVFIAFWLTFDGIGPGSPPRVRGVILMISDGFGPASQTMARNYVQVTQNKSAGFQLPLDKILIGSSRTRSSSSLVTDSAAGATAFSCALKTYNGAIGVDPNKKPCGTVLEAAKEKGFLTGLVVTSRITHATPASFSAHVASRDEESTIAVQQLGNYSLGRRVDLMFGGGRCFFLPKSMNESCRVDDVDPLPIIEKYNWTTFYNRSAFDDLDVTKAGQKLPLLGLFANDHMDYEIDRVESEQPSLKEMVQKAIHILDKESRRRKTGFFLMIEGSRIDMAAHSNDIAGHIHDIIEYNDVIDYVKSFVKSTGDTVMISTSDHETGGATAGRGGIYAWWPEAIAPIKHSSEWMATQIGKLNGTGISNISKFVRDKVFKEWFGDDDPDPVIVKSFAKDPLPDWMEITHELSKISAEIGNVGWTTYGHTAVDVNLYAYGRHADELRGNHENIEIGDFIIRNLGLDLTGVTEELKDEPIHTVGVTSTSRGDRYHHDY